MSTTQRTLDWRARFDLRSLSYRVAAHVTELPTTGRLWKHGTVLDQGAEGACVAFACSGEAAADPAPVPGLTDTYALSYYRRCQQLDEFPDTVEGTSVLAGCLTGRERGLWSGFRWAKSAEELAHGIVQPASRGGGPAVIGVEWRQGSYDTDELGVLRPSGPVVGGHCIVVLGFLPAGVHRNSTLGRQLAAAGLWDGYLSVGGPAFVILNSWGLGFGQGGLALVPMDVVRGWVSARGEFAIPVDRKVPAAMTSTSDDEGQGAEPADDAQPATAAPDRTLHQVAAQLEDGDRLVAGVPHQLGQETVTVLRRRVVRDWRGDRVRVTSTAGVFTLGASEPVTVRRSVA